MEYAAITKLDTECDKRARRGVLREAIHEDWSRLWSTGVLEVNDAHDWREIVELMSEYLRDQRSPLLDRLNFHDRSQFASESVEKYYAHLQILYDSCGFDLDMNYKCGQGGCNGEVRLVCNTCREDVDINARFRQRTLRDRLIFGLHDQDMQREVLKERLTDLTLNRTRDICRSHEGSTQTQDKIHTKEVHQVGKRGRGSNKSSYKQGKRRGDDDAGTGTGDKGGNSSTGTGTGAKGGETITDCGSRGLSHLKGACPAKEAKCRRCGEKGHFAANCPNVVKHNYGVSLATVAKGKWEPLLQLETVINGKAREMTWLVDTGAQVAIMGMQDVERFGAVKLKPSRIRLAMVDETCADIMGQVSVTVHTGERSNKLQVHVVEGFTKPTLNFRSIITLGLIEEGWPNLQQSSQDEDQVSHLTDKGLEGDEEVEETVREYSVGSVRVVGRAEEKTNKMHRKYKYPSWKEWCSVRMERTNKEQELGKFESRTEMYNWSGEDDNLKRAGLDAGIKREGRGFWRRRRGRRRPDRSKSGAFPRGQGFPVGAWRMARSG